MLRSSHRMEYKYNKQAGALNEVAPVALKKRLGPTPQRTRAPMEQSMFQVQSFANNDLLVSKLEQQEQNSTEEDEGIAQQRRSVRLHEPQAPKPPSKQATTGLDPHSRRKDKHMFFYIVREGERVQVTDRSGHVQLVSGPARIFRSGKSIEPLAHYVAHPGEFLIVRYRSGRQEHLAGPVHVWFNPLEHLSIAKEDALPIAAKEAVVVYSKSDGDVSVSRRIVEGPATFVPAPGEWLHSFSWHGSKAGDDGYVKLPGGLVFQKLWLLPDQMYHDVHDVRTADDAVLTIKLMLFFELIDLPKMLETTHDPIGDFINAATSDVVDFTVKHDFDSFKKHTEKLNDLGTYAQLTTRAAQCGYRINKVVYRGYGAPDSLQRMHDEAIESRTRLQLERATQQQAQELEDFKLEREIVRNARSRQEQESKINHELAQAEKRREADIRDQKARQEFARTQQKLDAELQFALHEKRDSASLSRLENMRKLGVDLTSYLTQGRADRVIELRSAQDDVHVHLDTDAMRTHPARE